MNKKGFTLVELLAVVAILAIIMVIAIPRILDSIDQSKRKSFFSSAKSIIREIDYNKLENIALTKTPLENLNINGISTSDYDLANSNAYILNNIIYLNLVGKGKFEGLYLCDLSESGSLDVKDSACKNYELAGLNVWYDGKNNSGEGFHNSSNTVWKNIVSDNYDGVLNGGTWGEDNLTFDGINDWVSIGQLNYSTPTVEIVGEVNQNQATRGYLIGNLETGGYGIYARTDSIYGAYVYITEISNYAEVNNTGTYGLNIKYTISISYDNSHLKLYINGALASSLSTPGNIKNPISNTILVLGANPVGSTVNGNYLNGKIYSARIYNRVLTDDEIHLNYEADRERFNF
jgi:prepilin-type N-terminal cleavage/methylation domain-containing protein